MKKVIKYVIIVVVVAVLAFGGYMAYNKFVLNKDNGLTIADTENVVSEVKAISKFTTQCFYEEITLVQKKRSQIANNKVGSAISNFFGKAAEKFTTDEICIVANGKVRAGYDFTKLGDDDVLVNGDTLSVKLPPIEIFETVVNPSDFDIFLSDGTWSHAEVTALQNKAKDRIVADAKKAGILSKAEESGKKQLESLFRSFGFKEVILD